MISIQRALDTHPDLTWDGYQVMVHHLNKHHADLPWVLKGGYPKWHRICVGCCNEYPDCVC
jgi:hypothetical protein